MTKISSLDTVLLDESNLDLCSEKLILYKINLIIQDNKYNKITSYNISDSVSISIYRKDVISNDILTHVRIVNNNLIHHKMINTIIGKK